MPKIVHTSLVGDASPFACVFECFPNRSQLPAHVLDDISGLGLCLLLLQTFQELRVDRNCPVCLGFTRINANSAGFEVNVVLRRFKWNSLSKEVGDWGCDQVDHGDEVRDVSVASGPGASSLEETV